MRVSSIQMFNSSVNQLLNQQQKLSEIQNQVATGKRISQPSDDPIGAAQIVLMNQQIDGADQFNKNIDLAEGQLNLEESLLTQSINIMQRIREIQVSVNNGSLNDADRASFQLELQQRADELAGIANTQDSGGNYMFSGYQSKAKTYTQDANGNYIYQGDAGYRELDVASGNKVKISDSGFKIFESVKGGNGKFQISDSGAANTGTGVIDSGSIIDSSAYVAETYSLTFVTNSSGDLAYQVVGSTSGQLVPVLPAVTPASAPKYVEGQSIQFNGVEVSITGQPIAGDDYQIEPAASQNIFQTINTIVAALDQPIITNNDTAVLQNTLNQSLSATDSALAQVNKVRSEIGARLNSLDSSRDINENFVLHSKSVLSSIEDLDLADAISRLNFQTVAYQAAQQSYVKVQGLSLFNFL